MQSIDLIRDNLVKSRDRVLARVEDMEPFCLVAPTSNGGGHTLWVLGHLAYIEGLVLERFARGEANPLADWEPIFDGDGVSERLEDYPPFQDVLAKCREMRERTLAALGALSEDDLDLASARSPDGHAETFGTYRLCFQFLSDHWYMHRGQLAASRRSADLKRMWF